MKIKLPSEFQQEIPAGIINGTNKVFTVANEPAELQLNGLYQTNGGVDYTLTGSASPFTITYVSAPVGSHISLF